MKIGVISRCRGKRKFGLISYFKSRKLTEKEIKVGDIKVTVINAFVFGKKLKKGIEKAKKRLSKKNAEIVLKDISLKNEEENIRLFELERKVFLNLAFKLYIEYIKLFELKAYKMKVLIADKRCVATDKALMEQMCFYSARCDIGTDNFKKAEKIADFIFAENGFFTEVKDNFNLSDYDAVINVDDKTVKISNKVFVDKIDFGVSEITDYNLNRFEVIKMLSDFGYKINYVKTVGNKAFFEIV